MRRVETSWQRGLDRDAHAPPRGRLRRDRRPALVAERAARLPGARRSSAPRSAPGSSRRPRSRGPRLEAAGPVEDQRGAVRAVGGALDGVEAFLAEVLEHAVHQMPRDGLALDAHAPEVGVDAEGEPVAGAGQLREAALVREHLRDREQRARIREQHAGHERAQEEEVPADRIAQHRLRELGVEVVADPLPLEADRGRPPRARPATSFGK